MTRKEKSANLKKKTPKKSEEENPAMQEAEINWRLLQNTLDQANAKADQKLREQLKSWRIGSPRSLRTHLFTYSLSRKRPTEASLTMSPIVVEVALRAAGSGLPRTQLFA